MTIERSGIVVDELNPGGAPPAGPGGHRGAWITVGLVLLVLAVLVTLFVLGVGDASADGGCGGG